MQLETMAVTIIYTAILASRPESCHALPVHSSPGARSRYRVDMAAVFMQGQKISPLEEVAGMARGESGVLKNACTPLSVVQPCMQTPLSSSSPLHGRLDPHNNNNDINLPYLIRRHVG